MRIEQLKKSPRWIYGMSIAATWAGVGSLMNFDTLAHTAGMAPAILWMAFNVFACGLFGFVMTKWPSVRDVFAKKPVMWFLGLMAVFQAWSQMNGVLAAWEASPAGSIAGQAVVYLLTAFFVVYLLWRGVFRNAVTDSGAWIAIYALVAVCAICSLVMSSGAMRVMDLGMTLEGVSSGVSNGVLLLSGPFTYAYFLELFAYNEENSDGVGKVDIFGAFKVASALFGAYMLFCVLFAFVEFNSTLSVLKAALLTFIGISSVSSCVFSIYVCFGKKLGFAINAGALALWQLLIPLGVMGAWQLMCNIRTPVVAALVLLGIGVEHGKKHAR